MSSSMTPATVITVPGSDLRLEIDPDTGAPARIWNGESEPIELSIRLAIVTGGREVRGSMGGLEYRDTQEVLLASDGHGPLRQEPGPHGMGYSWEVRTTDPDAWGVAWRLHISDAHPRLALGVRVRARADTIIARDIRLDLTAHVDKTAGWRVQAPGNPIRPDVELTQLTRPVAVSPAGGVDGSAGLVALEQPSRPRTLVVWPLCEAAIGKIRLCPASDGVTLTWATDVAGQPGAGGELAVDALHLDLTEGAFTQYLATVPEQLAAMGIASPDDPPDWAVACNLFEVQVGYGEFADGYRYGPYPTAADLLADLDRIADLGYDTLQIMPRQPYPSYNVHDYDDIDTSYGDEVVIRELVERCHERGMRVILDILMHGVIDGEVVDETIAVIRSGPWAQRLDEAIPDITSLDLLDPDERDALAISWAAHVVNFGPHWKAGSPRRHPLADEHPEWFCRDSAGLIIGMYTKGFDLAHPEWQRWFIDAALELVRRLDVDGFRFDAPSYNEFHNWSDRTRRNASVSMLGCLSLFETLRTELRALKPDALLYTEPSGALYRRSMDMTYNYDEQWLVRAVLTHGAGRSHWVRNARELGRWFADRDATLPRGSLTAHHLDSHDTFWWPHPGRKWRREQYGLEATGALMTMFALSGGPYMTFVGGEIGIEEQVRTVNRLRHSLSAFGRGRSDYDAVEVSQDDVYAVVRRLGSDAGLLLVNMSDHDLSAVCTLAEDLRVAGGDPGIATDLLAGMSTVWSEHGGRWSTALELRPWQAVAIRLAT